MRLHPDIENESQIWRLVLENVVDYSAIYSINFIDVLKLNAILDLRKYQEEKQQREMKQQMQNNNGN